MTNHKTGSSEIWVHRLSYYIHTGVASSHVDRINSLIFEDSISKNKTFQKDFAISFTKKFIKKLGR
jgi:hypothetical protein